MAFGSGNTLILLPRSAKNALTDMIIEGFEIEK
jgi:hypothetical protein